MATSGQITGTVKNSSGGNANSKYKFLLNWTRNNYNIENNTSNITVTLSIQRIDGYADSAANLDKKPSVTLKINEKDCTELNISYINTRNGKISTFMTWTGDVSHSSDGSYEENIEATFVLSGTTSLRSGSVNGTLAIDTIPRATLLTGFSCNTSYFDGALAYTRANAASESFTHSVSLYIEGREQPIFSCEESAEGFDKSNFKIGDESLSEIYMALGNKDRGSLVLGLKTKSGTTQIGEEQKKKLTLLIPESVVPVVEEIALTPSANKGILLQGMNQLQIGATAKASKGSTIDSYIITIERNSTIIYNNILSTLPVNLGPFSQPGDLSISITVKDKRGRVSAPESSEIYCYEYSLPSVPDFVVQRGNSDGSINSDGEYMIYSGTAVYSQVEENEVITTLRINNGSTEIIDLNNPVPYYLNGNTSSLQIYLTIKDKYYSGEPTSRTLLAVSRILNIAEDGKGLAIGKKAIKPTDTRDTGLFECQWDSEFNGRVDIKNSVDIQGELKVTIKEQATSLLEIIYPVGSIYISTNPVNPGNLFDFGTWEQIKNVFLLGASETYEANVSGGSSTLQANNLPIHTHEATVKASFLTRPPKTTNHNIVAAGENTIIEDDKTGNPWGNGISTSSYGDGGDQWPVKVSIEQDITTKTPAPEEVKQAEFMPPYLAVYMWKRVR